MSKADVTLVICTYNRCEMLRKTLESITRMRPPDGRNWEVLVVDNNCSDDTSAVAQAFCDRLPLRYSFEPRQGKTRALNRAVREAEGQLLCFTDDDVQLVPDWLQAFVGAADAYPEAGWFGGPIEPWWPTSRPSWLHEESLPVLSAFVIVYDLGDTLRWYQDGDEMPAGPSMAVRRATFDRIGGYREDLGPNGASKGTCDDTELTIRGRQHGVPGVYVPHARCLHYVQVERLRVQDFLRYGVGKGENQARMDAGCPSGSLWRAAWHAVRGLRQALIGRWDRTLMCSLNAGVELGRRRGHSGRRP